MKRVLIIDRQAPDVLKDELKKLRPIWEIIAVGDHHTALQMMREVKPTFDLIIINVGRVPCKLDPLAMLLVLKLGYLRNTRYMALLQYPWDERDNMAALAAGADRVHAYPKEQEESHLLLIQALHLLYRQAMEPSPALLYRQGTTRFNKYI